MKNWNGVEIKSAKSRGGKICLRDYTDNLIIPQTHKLIWPHPDIVKKLYVSHRDNYFDEGEFNKLTTKLGFYCDLQSLRSEDAITWSIFGSLRYFQKEKQVQFVNALLKKCEKNISINDCEIQLWLRLAHPDTGVSGGPEVDFLIVGDKVVIIGESKWMSPVAEKQGKKKNKNQIQLRLEYLQKYGKYVFSQIEKTMVLLVAIEKPHKDYNCAFLKWEDLCNESNHPLEKEIKDYYRWKLEHGR